MNVLEANGPRTRAALFVDFDNIYIALESQYEEAANRFATDVANWVAWLETGDFTDGVGNRATRGPRYLLLRRCYLNPGSFARYRPFFTRAGFEVVDCPSLTRSGKNSADIQMVMDILDTLEHKTRFDEFIILSGDSDFRPVLLRLRAHDRRTVVLTISAASQAYASACDHIISEDDFTEQALRIASDRPTVGQVITSSGNVAPKTLDRIAARVYEEATTFGELPAASLPQIFKEFDEFTPESSWLGFFSLVALTRNLVNRHKRLRIVEGDESWKVVVVREPPPVSSESPAAKGDEKDAARMSSEILKLRQKAADIIVRLVGESETPVVMATAAHKVRNTLGNKVIESQWLGAGSFRNLLEEIELPGCAIDRTIPGYVYDPERHRAPSEESPTDSLADGDRELASLSRRIREITGAPLLTAKEYDVLFRAIADEVNANGYSLNQTEKAVRDRCIEGGESISRANVSFVTKGIHYAGGRLAKSDPPLSARQLAQYFRRNIVNLCRAAQLELTEEELTTLDRWLLGLLPEE